MKTIARDLAFITSLAAMFLVVSPARAEFLNVHIAMNAPGSAGIPVESTSVVTMAYVTNSVISTAVGKTTYIEIIGNTATGGGFQLRLQSKDPQKVLAFWDQIAKATEASSEFQITVYAVKTFQVGDAAGFVGDLDTGLNYFLLF